MLRVFNERIGPAITKAAGVEDWSLVMQPRDTNVSPYHSHRCPAAGCLGSIVAPEKVVPWVISGIVDQYEPRLLE